MRPTWWFLGVLCGVSVACSSPHDAGKRSERSADAPAAASPAVRATTAASTTDLDTTPLSAADYAMYVSVMSGASALLSNLTPEDREALELARKVDAGHRKATAADEPLLVRARALQHKDEELAELQGVGRRYRQVKEKVNAVIGPTAQPPDRDDGVARENRRFLDAHRTNIERLQTILRDPLSRPKAPALGPGGDK